MSVGSPSQNDILNRLFEALGNKNAEIRQAAANDLRRYVTTAILDINSKASARLWDEHINRRLFDLIHSNNNTDKLGGVLAIDHLMDVYQEHTIENRRNLDRFYHYLIPLLPNADLTVMVAASKSLGKIAKIGEKDLEERFIDHEVPKSIEYLSATDKTEQNRCAGVLVLKELARNCPMYFNQHITAIFDKILLPLRDTRVHVREAASELLADLLDILEQGNRHSPEYQLLGKLIEQTLQGLKSTQVEIIHGSLLAYRELLLHSGTAMRDSFHDTAEIVFNHKSHKDILIRKTVISLIPTFASYDNRVFSINFLHGAMTHLLTQAEKPTERAIAYIAIGHVSCAVGSEMKPFLSLVMHSIKQALNMRGTRNAPTDAPILQCLGMLASSVGLSLTKLFHDQLDLIFNCDLSEPLRSALMSMAEHIPPLLKPIQDRLLDVLSVTLTGQAYATLRVPSGRTNVASLRPDSDTLILALGTLGMFNFSGHALTKFVQDAVLPYLEDDHVEVRKAAVLSCCRLFLRETGGYPPKCHTVDIVSDILSKLLTVGVADTDPTVRQIVLSLLDDRFEKYLAQAQYVRSLFIALNDEVFANRVQAVALIGRVAKYNPTGIIPSVRKALMQLLSELEYSTNTRNREDASRLLTLLISATHRLIKSYAPTMIRVLLPKASDANPVVASQTLMCIGELSSVGIEELTSYIPQIMSAILATLDDPAVPSRREAALVTLGQLCTNTSHVITPIIDNPQLRPLLGRILKSELSLNMRRQTLKVLGILGAIDPYQRKVKLNEDAVHEKPSEDGNPLPSSRAVASNGPDEYYQTIVIDALLGILNHRSFSNHNHLIVDSIMSIFKLQGFRCVSFLGRIIPVISYVTRCSHGRLQEHHLEQLSVLITLVKQHVRDFVPLFVELLDELWYITSLQPLLVSLVQALGMALNNELRPFLPSILPRLLQVFEGDLINKHTETKIKFFQTLLTIGPNIEEHIHLIIPPIVKSFQRPEESILLRTTAIIAIEQLSQWVNLSDHASRIIHPLLHVLSLQNNELRMAVMDTICALVLQLQSDFVFFIPTINKCLLRYQILHERYQKLVNMLLAGESFPASSPGVKLVDQNTSESPDVLVEARKLTPNQQHLKEAWDVSQVITKDDWADWFKRISVQFTRESSSIAIRSCINVLDAYPQIAGQLFNVAFLSCWGELYGPYQDDLVRSIERAITHTNIPPYLFDILLNLVEFMDREDVRLPIDNRTLGECALRFRAYGKALYYHELEFLQESSPSIVEALIGINTELRQHDSAQGMLTIAREQYEDTQYECPRHEEWLARLGRWEEALDAYHSKVTHELHTSDLTIGRMRCLHALSEWGKLYDLVNEHWEHAGDDYRRKIAPLAAAAAWSLGQWDSMDQYIGVMPRDSSDRSFYRAITYVHRNQFAKATNQILKARDLLDPAITSVIDDPGRVYSLMVQAQMLSELDEIITYKQLVEQPERQDILRRTWRKRLHGCQLSVEVWQQILQLRTLVLRPEDEPTLWIKFAHLCRKNNRMQLGEKIFHSLQRPNFLESKTDLRTIYAHLKFLWASGDRDQALHTLHKFSERLQHDLSIKPGESKESHQCRVKDISPILARCYVKEGQWLTDMIIEWTPSNRQTVLRTYYSAAQLDKKWYKAWHIWSLANFEFIGCFQPQRGDPDRDLPQELLTYVISAVEGFFRSIALCNDSALQDILRLLTLFFNFGSHENISSLVSRGLMLVEVDIWLEVLPQIMARIQTTSINIRRTITFLLRNIAKHHPQALIYHLTVASKSTSDLRKKAAAGIMNYMKEHSAVIVEQAIMVSQELIRVTILWHELWHEGLEEASRLYFTEQNPDGMIGFLEPLHEMLDAGPHTASETSFIQVFGRDLRDARDLTHRFLRFGETSDLDHAWDIYYGVFRNIEKQLPCLNMLDLQYASPDLLKARNLELAVPGTYRTDSATIRISSFVPKLTVITSKQRPRRLYLKGNDGGEYSYCLKGHEDLRQDERVMQLFNLVNTLLSVNTNSFKRRLHIQIFAVIPLAPNAGLVGWVPDSDTLHTLVRDYREPRRILLNLESRLMLQMAPDYEFLPLLQKVEVFEYVRDKTNGQDLNRMLWLRSCNSESWLNRRVTYSRSLAVNSMVGHILGLGDRHPNNILIQRITGKVVNIDFGDCFEVAMHREKFPEKVPFRLTRMLVNTMEVSSIQGSFKMTCQITMGVVRDNKDSLMALLEAFVYDPLISWRFVQVNAKVKQDKTSLNQPSPAVYVQGAIWKVKADESKIFDDDLWRKREVQNEHALQVFNRVLHKLTGHDYNPDIALPIEEQVDRLIQEATSLENLCQCFSGWCALW